MRATLRISLVPLALVALQACSALFPRPYRPYSGGAGYSEVQVAKDTWEVQYVGPSSLTEVQAKELAVLRAAELTRLMGGRWFAIVAETRESRRVRVVSEKVEHAPGQAADSGTSSPAGPAGGGKVTKVVTRHDDWIPQALLRIRMERTEGAESLDAESVLRMGRAKGLLAGK